MQPSPLSPQVAAKELLRRRGIRSNLTAWCTEALSPLGQVPALHHLKLIEALEAVDRGEIDRLMVCMPPGSAKSTYTSVLFPAWWLSRHPNTCVIAASHTQELAEHFGRKVRNIIAEHSLTLGLDIAADSAAVGRWGTAQGNEYFAAGVGGSVTGRRADLVVVDDPVKSREDADSERSREKAWDWYVHDLLTRLKPGAKQIVVMTRWHEDDLGGRILERERERWTVIEIPMEAMPDDILGRAVGERLWPEWFTDDMVETAKRDPRAWNALYQQQPASDDGDYFKREWFNEYDELPSNLRFYAASDFAVTDAGGDYTEHGVFGLDHAGNLYVADWWRGQTTSDVWIDRMCDLILKYQPLCWFGEAGPIRRALEPYLMRRIQERNAACRIEWMASVHDKPTRCRSFQALASMGKVFLPKHAGWKSDVYGQLMRFPAGKHDDAVDVCSLIGRGLEVIRPKKPIKPVIAAPSGSWMAA